MVFSGVGVVAALLVLSALAIPGRTPTGPAAGRARRGAAARPLQLALWLFTLPALFSGTLGVLVPLRLDDIGAGAVTIGAMFLVGAGIEALLNPILGRFSDQHGRMPPIRAGLAGARPDRDCPAAARGLVWSGCGGVASPALLGAGGAPAVRRLGGLGWTRASRSG